MSEVRREPVKQFWSRVEREGRRAEAEADRERMLAEGNSNRLTQARLVQSFQPLDGSKTRAWSTPNSWAYGRLDAKKLPPERQEQLEQDAMWVHGNLDKPLDQAPSPGARLLLVMAQQNPTEFLKIYLKCVPSMDRRAQKRFEARRQKFIDRREKERKRAQADRRLYYREEARIREAAEKEARQQAEAQKQAAQAEARQRGGRETDTRAPSSPAGK